MNMNNINEELLIKKVMRNHPLFKAPEGFTDSVMDNLPDLLYRSKYEPLINKKGWFAIAGIVSSLLLIVFIIVITSAPPAETGDYNNITLFIDKMNLALIEIISFMSAANIYLIVSVSAGLLIVFEILMRNLGKN